MVKIKENGIAAISPEALPELTFDSPEAAIGSLELSLETIQLMAKQALSEVSIGDAGVSKTLNDLIEYAAFQRARVEEFEKNKKG